jgi:hypothetical protein
MTNKINLTAGYILLDVLVFKEDEHFIAYAPALNLTSHSKDKKRASTQLQAAVSLFFDYWKKWKVKRKVKQIGMATRTRNKKTKAIC